jgi:hypothetical protein
MPKQLSQHGFHVIELIIILTIISLVGFVGFKVLVRNDDTRGKSATDKVKWIFDSQNNRYYVATGKAPACKKPFTFDQTPVDLSQLTLVAMPGAYRGYDYKPHGGFRADNSPDGHLAVRMPMDATLVALTRYYEGNPPELQYVLTFESDCGIAFRFDHLNTLAPAFQAIADTTPAPRLNDTRTDPNVSFKRTKFKAGDLIATGVGFPQARNFGFDFGVYDYRQPNQISKNAEWRAIHSRNTALDWFGVCWFDMLPGTDAARAKELASIVLNPAKPNANKVSDYCPMAPYRTLDFNHGQPVDG